MVQLQLMYFCDLNTVLVNKHNSVFITVCYSTSKMKGPVANFKQCSIFSFNVRIWIKHVYKTGEIVASILSVNKSSVIRQKGESQTCVYVSGGKKCSVFEKLDLLCFLVTPVSRFTFFLPLLPLFPYYDVKYIHGVWIIHRSIPHWFLRESWNQNCKCIKHFICKVKTTH